LNKKTLLIFLVFIEITVKMIRWTGQKMILSRHRTCQTEHADEGYFFAMVWRFGNKNSSGGGVAQSLRYVLIDSLPAQTELALVRPVIHNNDGFILRTEMIIDIRLLHLRLIYGSSWINYVLSTEDKQLFVNKAWWQQSQV